MTVVPFPCGLHLCGILLGFLLFVAVVTVPIFEQTEQVDVQSYDDRLLGLHAAGLAGQILALLKAAAPSYKGPWVAEASVTTTQTVIFSTKGKISDADERVEGERDELGVGEKFLFPMVDERWGVGNQLQELISAAYSANVLNRTLCLANPLAQPKEHKGGDDLSTVPKWSDHFSLASLGSVVRMRPMEECVSLCGGVLEELYFMESYFLERDPDLKYPTWDDFVAAYGLRLGKKVPPRYPTSRLDSRAHVEEWFADARHVACLGTATFLGLRFREPWRRFYSQVQPSDKVRTYADVVQQQLLRGRPYLALHWRVEELRCRNKPRDTLCFVRCNFGALWAPSLVPAAAQWNHVAEGFDPDTCEDQLLATVTGVTVEDFVAAVVERMAAAGLRALFLSTDGFIRGREMCDLVEKAIAALLTHEQVSHVVVLEHCRDTGDGALTRPAACVVTHERGSEQSGEGQLSYLLAEHASLISLVEQEVCARAAVFLGTSESSWSMQVAQAREYAAAPGGGRVEKYLRGESDARASARAAEARLRGAATSEALAPFANEDGAALAADELELLSGGACFFRQNFPLLEVGGASLLGSRGDHWVDYLACEGRLEQGGRCRAECSSED